MITRISLVGAKQLEIRQSEMSESSQMLKMAPHGSGAFVAHRGVVVDSSQLSMANWLTCAKCMLSVSVSAQSWRCCWKARDGDKGIQGDSRGPN